MAKKCYELNYIQQFNSDPFIYERTQSSIETTFTYQIICKSVEKIIDYFKQENIKTNIGIAVNIREHSVDACILLLSVLNYNCYVYLFNDEIKVDILHNIKSSGVSYVCVKQSLKEVFEIYEWNQLKDFKIISDIYSIWRVSDVEICKKWPCCYAVATSGSTGIPKMVFVPYKCLEPNIISLSSLLKITSNDRIFVASPATFDPFMVEFFLALQNGCALIVTSKSTRFMIDNFVDKYSTVTKLQKGATILQTTPSLFRLFGRENIQNVLLDEVGSLRCLILGGEEFPSTQELISWLPTNIKPLEKFSKRIFNIYGITEVSCWSCIYEFKMNQHLYNEPVPLGKTLDNDITLEIVKKNGQKLRFDDNCPYIEGELKIGGISRKCYISNDVEHEMNITNELQLRSTGDLVLCNGNGNIYYQGRLNNTIKRLGKRLCLDMLAIKIKDLLCSNNMNAFDIVCLWDKEHVKLIYAIKGYPNRTLSIILNEHLEKYEQPDKLYFIRDIPLTYHGKINRSKLMEHIKMMAKEEICKSPTSIFQDFLQNIFALDTDFSNTLNEKSGYKEKRLKNFQNYSFAQIGGSSYQALSLATEISNSISEATDQRLLLQMLLDHNVTLADIYNFLYKANYLDKLNCTEKSKLNQTFLNTGNYDLELMWRMDLLKCVDANPSLYGNQLVAVGSHSHLLLVIEIETGKALCKLELPDRIECSVEFINDHLAAVGCYNGYLYIFNYRTGKIEKDINVNGLIKAKPLFIFDDALLIVATYGELFNVVAVCLKFFVIKWRLKLGGKGIYASPITIDKNTSLICTLDGTCGWLNNANGNITKTIKFHSPVFSTPVLIQTRNKENFLIIAEVCGKVSLCNSNNGKVLYDFQASGNIFSSIAVHYQRVEGNENEENIILVFGSHDWNVYVLNFQPKQRLTLLTLLWKISCESPIYATPLIIYNPLNDSFVFICTTKGTMKLLKLMEPQSKPLIVNDLKAEIFSTPCCLNNKYLFIGCRDNFLHAFQINIW